MRATVTVLDLRECNEGMSCDEFTTLVVAGPSRDEMPASVRKLMDQHERTCPYHGSPGFRQSALDMPITIEAEQAAQGIIQKYS
jgi:hypothetical protein